jgi:glucose-6-phosphate isomerase
MLPALEFFGQHEIDQQQDIVKTIHKTIHESTGAGSDFIIVFRKIHPT